MTNRRPMEGTVRKDKVEEMKRKIAAGMVGLPYQIEVVVDKLLPELVGVNNDATNPYSAGDQRSSFRKAS